MSISKKILEARKLRQLTQVALADLMGVEQKDISRWESGGRVPNVESLIKLCNVLSFSADWFLGIPDFQKQRYLAFSCSDDGFYNEDVKVFETLTEANHYSYYCWKHLTDNEKSYSHFYVRLVRDYMIVKEDIREDLELTPLDNDYWLYFDYNQLEEVKGGFDSDNLK